MFRSSLPVTAPAITARIVAAVALAAGAAVPAHAQARRVTARVTDQASGAPIPGASVAVPGTNVGGVTDERGVAAVRITAGAGSLVVRRIGYQQRSVTLAAGDTAVAVALVRDVLRLETQVVTGAATSISRRNAANDVAQVSAEQLTQVAAPSVENALAGRIAGAQIVQNSGAPGGGNQVRLRGITSVFGNADQLYVIDGVIVSNDVVQPGVNAVSAAARASSNASNQDNGVNRIADLNPNDIESIDVLKGASAASIYGSKASNGVIIIRTKRGSTAGGRAQVDVLQRLGTRALLNKFGARRFTLDEARARGASVGLTQAQVDSNYASCGGFCDYEQQLFGARPFNYETNASVRGGTAGGTDYFASAGLLNDGGIQRNTGYQKQSGLLNLGQTIGSRLAARLSTNVIRTLTARGISNNDNANITPYFVFAGTPSFYDLRPRGGVYPTNPFSVTNPFQNADFLKTPDEVYRVRAGGSASYSVFQRPSQSLDLRFDGGVDRTAETAQVISPRFLYFEPNDGLPGTIVQNNTGLLYYNANLNAIHSYTVRGGPTRGLRATTSVALLREVSTNRSTNTVTRDVLAGQENPGLGSSNVIFANRQATRGLAVFGQEELLLLDERLLLTVGARSERSTSNGDRTRFYTFPKAAASYRWTRPLAFVDELKPRIAWGQAGNLPLYIQRFSPAQAGVYAGQNTLQQGLTNGNAAIRPERQTEIEGGVDVTLFGSRAALALTGYQKTIDDVIFQVASAPSLGYNVSILNGGSIRNRGIEASLNATPVRLGRFAWNSNTTFSRNVAIVTALPPGVQAFNVERDASGQRVAFGAGYGIARLEVGKRVTQIVGQGCNGTCLVPLGDGAPRFVLGLANDVTYGPVRASALLDWQPGASNVNVTQNVYDGGGLAPDQPDGGAARARANDQVGNSQYIQKASFAMLREATLSYDLPPALTRRAFGAAGRSLRLEAGGRNLFLWTRYPGVSPEVSNFGSQQISRFIDLAPFPPSRTFYLTLAGGF